MRFKEYIDDFEDLDIVDGWDYLDEKAFALSDWGQRGKDFEKAFINALDLVGLKVDINRYAGRVWDILPKSKSWISRLLGKQTNIKQHRTKWMFGSSELVHMLPWDGFKGEYDTDKAAKKVRKFIMKLGLHKVVYLKPATPEINTKIKDIGDNITITNADEKEEEARKLFSGKNFFIEKLESGWDVRILTQPREAKNGGRVSSIAIDSGGKVFMRSEKPRIMEKTNMVTFRTPSHIIGKGQTRSIMK